MATTRFPFSAGSLAALGISVDSPPDDLAARLGFPAGVRVTSVKADDQGGAVLNVSGAKLADGTDATGEVTGTFYVGTTGRVTFDGFKAVGDGPAQAEPVTAGAEGS